MNQQLTTPEGRTWLMDTLHNHHVSVTFTKADGTERTMLCTLVGDDITPHDKKTERTKVRNEDTVAVWDLEKKAWRSFRLDSIITISIEM